MLRQDLHGYSTRSDIYSLGIVACECANGFPPFADMQHLQVRLLSLFLLHSPLQMLFEKLRGTVPRLLDSTTLPADDVENEDLTSRTFSAVFHEFTEVCLRTLPQQRPTALELQQVEFELLVRSQMPLLQHSFIKQARKNNRSIIELIGHGLTPLTRLAGRTEEVPHKQESGTVDTEWIFDE